LSVENREDFADRNTGSDSTTYANTNISAVDK